MLGLEGEGLEAGLLDVAAAVIQAGAGDVQAGGVEGAAAVVNGGGGVQGQGLGGADEAAVGDLCGGVELGVGGGLKAAGVLQKTIHGDGEGALVALSWPALRTPRPCSVPIRVILPAYMPPRAETSRATGGAVAWGAGREAVGCPSRATVAGPVVVCRVWAQRPALSWTVRAMRAV